MKAKLIKITEYVGYSLMVAATITIIAAQLAPGGFPASLMTQLY